MSDELDVSAGGLQKRDWQEIRCNDKKESALLAS